MMSHAPSFPASAARPIEVALVGAGSVGNGWAAAYLAKGHRVHAYDPSPDAPARTRAFLHSGWSALHAVGLTEIDTPPLDNIRFAPLVAAVREAEVIHENAPEDLTLKQATLAEIELAAASDALICSSSGGLPPSAIQARMTHPERFVIAHPFNPPHLIPLVEVIGGDKTSDANAERAMEIMRGLGKKPIRLKREMIAYLTNRLQFALLREAIHCLTLGVADARSIDDAIRYALAPRWLAMGGLMTLTLAGGNGGMEHVIKQFAPAIDKWWGDLGEPHFTPETITALTKAGEELTDGRPISEWVAMRDRKLVELLDLMDNDPLR